MTKRVTMPVLLVLIAFAIGAGLVVYHANELAMERDESARGGSMAVELGNPAPETSREGGWQRHSWGPDSEAGEEGNSPGLRDQPGRIPTGPTDDAHYDPQMWAMRRSFRLEDDAGVAALPFSPSEHEARIVDSEGLSAPADRCEVRVLPVQTHQFNCLVRVVCGGQVLYPNSEQTAGYAPCDVEDGMAVSARDDGHTAADGDPLVSVDLRSGIVTVEDRGNGVSPFRATLRIGRRML